MKWRCKRERYGEWHDWFAWYPKRMGTCSRPGSWAWLETVERRMYNEIGPFDYWEYRAKAEEVS